MDDEPKKKFRPEQCANYAVISAVAGFLAGTLATQRDMKSATGKDITMALTRCRIYGIKRTMRGI